MPNNNPNSSEMTIRQALNSAIEHHQAGRLTEAKTIYRRVLARQPYHDGVLHLLGMIAYQEGQLQQAMELINHAITINPREATYQNNFGNVLKDLGRLDEAIKVYRVAVDLEPNSPDTYNKLGITLKSRGDIKAAIEAYHNALRLRPDFAEVHNNLGNALKAQGDMMAAIEAYQHALKLQPDFVEVYINLGAAMSEQGLYDAAMAAYQEALRLKPGYAEAHNYLGQVFMEQGKFEQSLVSFHAALKHNPRLAEACNNLGMALMKLGQSEEAIEAFHNALEINPNYPQTYNNLGTAQLALGQKDAALASFHMAIQLRPDLAEPRNNLAKVLRDQGKIDEAIAAYGQALQLKSDLPEVYNNLGNALKDQGQLDQAIAAYRTALRLKPDYLCAYSNILYGLHFHPGYDARAIGEEHQRWNRQIAAPLKEFIKPHTPPDSHRDDPERRLKVGYVSPDFYSHAESHFVTPLLEAHDHRQFEIHCYASVMRPDHITERLRRGVDVWHNVLGKSDADLAQQIREDQIDILVDLTMHMANNRLLVFAQKPAPVQVTWLAYPGSTGLDTIDYRLTDAFMDPPGVATPYFTEEAVRLPDCWCCYDPLSDAAPKPPRQDGPICFGSLNNPCKLNDQVLNLWGKVLEATPDSRLLILTFSVEHQKHMRQLYERMGIESQRLIFVKRCPREQYLRLYDRIDIGLDPLPYNGITTTLDALWMGVPVISLAGSTAAGRAGLGILSTLGLPELVVQTPEQYVEIAVKLAGDLPGLKELRSTLRQRMQASPLMDAKRFARNVESAYHTMWRKWCSGCAEKVES
jgi:protein O-GlcNAc transferase